MLLDKELLRAVKHLEIVAKREVQETLAGEYESAFKGRGMDFTGVRKYQPGDDIRVIDWNVSARMNELYVKQYVEERELTVLILVDGSASQYFATASSGERRAGTKIKVAAEMAALLAFSAIENNDRVGLSLFTDEVETFLPPAKGQKHVRRLLAEINGFQPESRATDLKAALEHLTRMTKKRAVVFLMSDFLDEGWEQTLKVVNRRHELVPVVVTDPLERAIREGGFGVASLTDPETGQTYHDIDTISGSNRSNYGEERQAAVQRREQVFSRHAVEALEITTGRNHVARLVEYFKRRASRI